MKPKKYAVYSLRTGTLAETAGRQGYKPLRRFPSVGGALYFAYKHSRRMNYAVYIYRGGKFLCRVDGV